MNRPTTLPVLEKKPPLFFCGVGKVDAGWIVGVIVNVLTCPVTVVTEMTGVGVHVELGDEDAAALEKVDVDELEVEEEVDGEDEEDAA